MLLVGRGRRGGELRVEFAGLGAVEVILAVVVVHAVEDDDSLAVPGSACVRGVLGPLGLALAVLVASVPTRAAEASISKPLIRPQFGWLSIDPPKNVAARRMCAGSQRFGAIRLAGSEFRRLVRVGPKCVQNQLSQVNGDVIQTL